MENFVPFVFILCALRGENGQTAGTNVLPRGDFNRWLLWSIFNKVALRMLCTRKDKTKFVRIRAIRGKKRRPDL